MMWTVWLGIVFTVAWPRVAPLATTGAYTVAAASATARRAHQKEESQVTADAAIFEALKGVTTATITTILLKKGLRKIWMRGPRPLREGLGRVVGRAFTLRFVPAREDLATPKSWSSPTSTARAIEAMPEGCIAVADAMGIPEAGIFGDILCARMMKRGVAALVTDGAVRDVAGVLGTGLPVWAPARPRRPRWRRSPSSAGRSRSAAAASRSSPTTSIVADNDGAVLIQQIWSRKSPPPGAEQERLEAWIMREVERGEKLPGLYPPNAETKARYEAEKKR